EQEEELGDDREEDRPGIGGKLRSRSCGGLNTRHCSPPVACYDNRAIMKPVSEEKFTDGAQAFGADVGPRGGIATEDVEAEPRSMLSDWDYHLFNEGSHHRLWEKLGARLVPGGAIFGVWAPNAASVSVIGDWNNWDPSAHRLEARGESGIWESFVPH